MTLNPKTAFLQNESGAVTVDWVVLTAALVGLGLAVMGVVSGGIEDLSGDVDTQLRADDIISTSFAAAATGYAAFDQVLYDGQYSGLMSRVNGVDGEYSFDEGFVLAQYSSNAGSAAQELANGNQAAAQYSLDLAVASRDAAIARGIAIAPGDDTLDATIAAYNEAYPNG